MIQTRLGSGSRLRASGSSPGLGPSRQPHGLRADGHLRGPQHVIADAVPAPDHAGDVIVQLGCIHRHDGYGFVEGWFEPLTDRFDFADAVAFELRQELVSHHPHALEQRSRVRTALRRIEGTVEVVDHFEEIDQQRPASALDFARDFPPSSDPGLLELGARGLELFGVRLKHPVLLGQPRFKLFDVRRLRLRRPGVIVRARLSSRPPTAIDDFDRGRRLVASSEILLVSPRLHDQRISVAILLARIVVILF